MRDAFERFQLWSDRVRLVEGLFVDTLPSLPIASLAILRLDGDLFSSTLDILKPLYPKLSPGGFVIVDDYFAHPGCRAAVEAYRLRHGIATPMTRIDSDGRLLEKGMTGDGPMSPPADDQFGKSEITFEALSLSYGRVRAISRCWRSSTALLRPQAYVEIGVADGSSFRLARHCRIAIGIDPAPRIDQLAPSARIIRETSQAYLRRGDLGLALGGGFDFALIDGSHLVEDALAIFWASRDGRQPAP